MDQVIKNLTIKETTDTCPVCGYSDGFHVSFKDTMGRLRIILICPECHARFDPSWEISRTILQKV